MVIQRLYTILFLLMMFSLDSSGQCAMCKAVLESEQELNETALSQGINDGIVYLMGVPYLLIAGFLIYHYKKEIRTMLADAF